MKYKDKISCILKPFAPARGGFIPLEIVHPKDSANRARAYLSGRQTGMSFLSGFTLIEILIVMGILSILITIVIVAINPTKQFAQARNAARQSHVRVLVTASTQLMIDNRGIFICASGGTLPNSPMYIKSGVGGYNLCPCIVPTYMPQVVIDPSNGSGKDCANYDTGYTIQRDAVSGRITVSAPSAENNETISMTY